MPETLSRSTVEFVRKAILAFYVEERRDLPWRLDSDPYRILVSEMMLQQTRAETVIPYFERWMERFPTMHDLAYAETDDVLRQWQGLGYYRRARHLHAAVRELVSRYHGAVPRSPSELRELPGVGPYTAGAVASIAFGVCAPAVDGNVRRVLARFMDVAEPSSSALESWAGALVDPADPGSFNQGLMELGARVCVPRNPACSRCPLERRCRARRAGRELARPARAPRRRVPRVSEAVAALVHGADKRRSVLLRRRPGTGLLGGMWEVPGTAVPQGREPEEVARERAQSLAKGTPTFQGALDPLDHVFSHKRVRYLPYVFSVADRISASGRGEADRMLWVESEEADELPISVAQRKILKSVYATNLPTRAL